jgi:hypothetical protein
MKDKTLLFALAFVGLTTVCVSAPVTVGSTPQGDSGAVAARIIKSHFPQCRRVTRALRAADGSIHASCDGTDYLVFTVFDAKKGKTMEVAMNCTASRQILNVVC